MEVAVEDAGDEVVGAAGFGVGGGCDGEQQEGEDVEDAFGDEGEGGDRLGGLNNGQCDEDKGDCQDDAIEGFDCGD